MTLCSRPRADLLAEAQTEDAKRLAVKHPKPTTNRPWYDRPRVILRKAAKPGEANGYGYAVVKGKKK